MRHHELYISIQVTYFIVIKKRFENYQGHIIYYYKELDYFLEL